MTSTAVGRNALDGTLDFPSRAGECRRARPDDLNRLILNGALELLPQSLASMGDHSAADGDGPIASASRRVRARSPIMSRSCSRDRCVSSSNSREQISHLGAGRVARQDRRRLLGGMGSLRPGAGFSFATTYTRARSREALYAGGRTSTRAGLQRGHSRRCSADANRCRNRGTADRSPEQSAHADLPTKLLSVVKSLGLQSSGGSPSPHAG